MEETSPLATVTVARADRISEETASRVRELLAMIEEAEDSVAVHNQVIPTLSVAEIPGVFHEQLVHAVQRKLKRFGAPVPIAKLRGAIFPPALPRAASRSNALPEWSRDYVFVANGNRFFNTANGTSMDMIGFQACFGEKMPLTAAGHRENAAERCLHFWGMPKVQDVGYRPDCGSIFTWDGARFANSYSPSSLPDVPAVYTKAGCDGIAAFQALMWDMCNRREDVFYNLLYWFAHNVQFPGRKIRWAPIIKGIHGDGKTLAASVLRAAMGYRNLSTTSNSNISNSGGFTDWAVRGAVNVIEEIMLTGKARHQLYNAMKEFITNDVVDINSKGAKPRQVWNCTNHWANTNHNDALPLEPTDRRWFVVFTPWADMEGMLRYCGLDSVGWKARTDAVDYVKTNCPGELRKWLLSIPIPHDFDINGSAMMTPEKRRMMATGKDDVESVIQAMIDEGSEGITAEVISTSHLSRALTFRAPAGGFDAPKTTALAFMLSHLGYSKLDHQLKWRGETLRLWVRNGVELNNDQLRSHLDSSLPNLLPG